MANGKCLSDACDNAVQREKYISLVSQIITTNIPCLEFLSSVTVTKNRDKRKDRHSKKNSIAGKNCLSCAYFFANLHRQINMQIAATAQQTQLWYTTCQYYIDTGYMYDAKKISCSRL